MRLSLVALALLLPATAVAQQPEPPAKEVEALKKIVGVWKWEGTAESGPFGPGGPLAYEDTCELFPGGHHVVCRSSGKVGDRPLEELTVYYWDAAAKTYKTIYVSRTGETGVTPFSATADGFAWQVQEQTPDGPLAIRGSVAFAEGNQSAALKNEVRVGADWKPMVTSRARRVK